MTGNEHMGIDCKIRGCVYEIECQEDGCKRKYVGTTGRSLYERMREHKASMRGRSMEDLNNPLRKHSEVFHEGKECRIGVRVIDREFGRPSRRLISESVRIEELGESESMNNKSE